MSEMNEMKEQNQNKVFITGIGTDIGKTVVASILVEALGADYWKPIQCGNLDFSDTERVKSLVSNPRINFYPETFRLRAPLSPDQAATQEGLTVLLSDFHPPVHDNLLVIEGAGGLLVPFNERETQLDLIKKFHCPVIVVVRNYLGSLNHSLLTFEVLQSHRIPCLGIIFCGSENQQSEKLLLKKSQKPNLGIFREQSHIDRATIGQLAKIWKENWQKDFPWSGKWNQ